MNLLATAASIIGAALVGRPLSSDALKLGVGAAKSSTVDSYFGLERLLALVSVLTTVSLTLVADTQYLPFGVQAPYSYTTYPSVYILKATRTTRLAATPSNTIGSVDNTNVGLWIAGIVLALVGGSGTALIWSGRTGQNYSSARPAESGCQEGDDPGGRRQPLTNGPPQPWPPPPPADPPGGRDVGSNGSRSTKFNNVPQKSNSREDPPPPPPPPTTTACGDDNNKPEAEHFLFSVLLGLCLAILAKVINKYIKKLGKRHKAPRRDQSQPARMNVSKTATRALAICVLPVVPLTLLAGCAWDHVPPYAPGKLGHTINSRVILTSATLATVVLLLIVVVGRTVLGIFTRFYIKMTGDYHNFDEDIDDRTWTGDDSDNDDNASDNEDSDGDDNNDSSNEFYAQQSDIEDSDYIDDDDLGSDFFGEQYDIDDVDCNPDGSPQGSNAADDFSDDETNQSYLGSGNESDEDDLDVLGDALPLDSSMENISASPLIGAIVTPPRRPVPRGEPDWTPNDTRRAFAFIRRRAIMAGVSPIPGGLLNSPPSPTGTQLSPLKLPAMLDQPSPLPVSKTSFDLLSLSLKSFLTTPPPQLKNAFDSTIELLSACFHLTLLLLTSRRILTRDRRWPGDLLGFFIFQSSLSLPLIDHRFLYPPSPSRLAWWIDSPTGLSIHCNTSLLPIQCSLAGCCELTGVARRCKRES